MKLFFLLLVVILPVSAAGLSDQAYQVINARTALNRSQFAVYQDIDSPSNHGFPSGLFGSSSTAMSKLHTDPGCVYQSGASNGCATLGTALDRTGGTVFRLTFDPLTSGEYVGLNFEEPQNWGTNQTGNGYDLTGATQLVFDAVSSTGGMQVQFSVNGVATGFYSVPASWTTMTINLSSLGLNSLKGVHLLFGVATNDVNASRGGTILIDNVHFTPVPAAQTNALGMPLANDVFGVLHVSTGVTGPIPVPPDQVEANLSTLYESSLALIALLNRGTATDLASVRIVADTLVYEVTHDNHGDPLPSVAGGAGLHNGTFAGDIALFNSQGAQAGQQGQIRLAGFTAPTLCPQSGFCLVLDGATGGNNAFAVLALAAAYKQFQNPAYLSSAVTVANWIYALRDPASAGYGGYFIGYPDGGQTKTLQMGKSVENNADIFAAFTALASALAMSGDASSGSTWTDRANIAGDFVMQMFDKISGHFYAGTVPAAQGPGAGIYPKGPQKGGDVINTFDFLDSQTFTTLAMAASPRYRSQIDWHQPLQWVLTHFQRTVTAGGLSFQGFDLIEASEHGPNDGPSGIAWEFTAQTVAGIRMVDSLYGTSQFSSPAASFLSQLQSAQATAPFTDRLGVVASTLQNGDSVPPATQCLVTPFQCIPERVGLAATSWAIMAEQGINPFAFVQRPQILPNGVVPVSSSETTIQPGEWISIFGTNFAPSPVSWNGDFPTSLGGVSVTINAKAAFLSYVSPTQINAQAPDDSPNGAVSVAVTNAGGTASSVVTLASAAPSFLLLDSQHVAAIITRLDGTGHYGNGTYDIAGPSGSSLGYITTPAKAGDLISLYAVGLGPTNPVVSPGKPFSGAAPTTNPVQLVLNGTDIRPDFAGLSGAGLYQINFTVPASPGTGDVPIVALVSNAQTQPTVVLSLQ